MHNHRAHDYDFLIRRWRAVARRAGLRLEFLEPPVCFLRSPALESEGGFYVSAGIHGDEAASCEALIAWAEDHWSQLAALPMLLLPCLNPWGLVHNKRADADGTDLNRAFHLDNLPLISAIKALVSPYQFGFSMMLHEDYDAQGLYLYEVPGRRPFWGESLLRAASKVIAIESRPKIDGHKAEHGLIRRRVPLKKFEQIGYPEAIWLHRFHSQRTFTLETPSEFGLDQRVNAQKTVIEAAVEKWFETE